MNWVTLTVEPWMPIGADKAKEDFAKIAAGKNFKILKIDRAKRAVDLSQLAADDLVIHQYPSYLGDNWEEDFEKKLQEKGIRFALLIHDFEPLCLTAQQNNHTAMKIMQRADLLIVHNNQMAAYFSQLNPCVYCLNLFDYLTDLPAAAKGPIQQAIVYAGSLVKAAWLQHYPLSIPITVFGRIPKAWHFQLSQSIHIKAPIDPNSLPQSLPAAWGLVWDEDLNPAKTHYQDYEKWNSPHKLSLYLAAGLPVIVWEKAAIASFVQQYYLGLVIHQLSDITDEALSNCPVDFIKLSEISNKLSQGYFTSQLLDKIVTKKKATPDDYRPK